MTEQDIINLRQALAAQQAENMRRQAYQAGVNAYNASLAARQAAVKFTAQDFKVVKQPEPPKSEDRIQRILRVAKFLLNGASEPQANDDIACDRREVETSGK